MPQCIIGDNIDSRAFCIGKDWSATVGPSKLEVHGSADAAEDLYSLL